MENLDNNLEILVDKKRKCKKKWLEENMHENIIEILERLKLKLIGHYRYYGVNGNYNWFLKFYEYIKLHITKCLKKENKSIQYHR